MLQDGKKPASQISEQRLLRRFTRSSRVSKPVLGGILPCVDPSAGRSCAAFHFSIYFDLEGADVIVFAVLHQRRTRDLLDLRRGGKSG